ncbi:MAG: YqiJ family protein [Tannerella sp.]|jgi:hypothetical protein|nr:YqiJ family protein [Tannerella sp.]
MGEFFYGLMHPLPNAVMTVIMGILAVYWLFTFLFGVGVDDLGFDVDVDVPEADVPDADISGAGTEAGTDTGDSEQEVAAEKSPGLFMRFLNFVNIGRVPFMLVLSTFKFFVWVGSLVTTSLVNVTSWGLYSLFILIPIAIAAVFFTKFATNPMVRFFREIGYKGEDAIDFLGRSGKMLSTIKGEKIGTAEFTIDNNPIKLSVKSLGGDEIKYGDYVVVMDESEDKKYYLVNRELSIRNF